MRIYGVGWSAGVHTRPLISSTQTLFVGYIGWFQMEEEAE